MKLKIPYTNVLHNKLQTNTKEVPLASQLTNTYFSKILAIKEATEYIKNGQRVPIDLINQVNIYEIQQQLKVHNKKEDVQDSGVKIFNSSLPDGFEDYSTANIKSLSNTMSMAMKAKIEYYKMMTPNYTLLQFGKVEYKSPTAQLASDINKSQDFIYDVYSKDIIDSKSIKTPTNLELFNPLNINQKGNVITFVDEYTNKDVNVILTPMNMVQISNKFGSLNTTKAKDYVKDWYYESAYKVGYLEANKSQTGFLNKDEALDLKNIYVVDKNGNVKDNVSPREYFGSIYKAQEFVKKFGYYNNINDSINKSIELDKDFSGAIEFKTILGDNANSIIKAFHKNDTLDIVDINKYLPSHITKRFVAKGSEKPTIQATNNEVAQDYTQVVA